MSISLNPQKFDKSYFENIKLDPQPIPDYIDKSVIDQVSRVATQSQENSSSYENQQLSLLAMKAIQDREEEEAYQREMAVLSRRAAEKAGVNLEEGSYSSPAKHEAAMNFMNSFNTEELQQYAPNTYDAMSQDFMDLEEVKDIMDDIGIQTTSDIIKEDLAKKIQIAESFHRNFDDQNRNYFEELKKSVPAINDAFRNGGGKKAFSLATTAVMAFATGGTSLAVKGGFMVAEKIVTNEKIKSVGNAATNKFRSFLEDQGVNLAPFDKAKESLTDKAKKLWGNKFVKGAGLGALTIAGAAIVIYTNDIDLDSITSVYEKAVDWGQNGPDAASEFVNEHGTGLGVGDQWEGSPSAPQAQVGTEGTGNSKGAGREFGTQFYETEDGRMVQVSGPAQDLFGEDFSGTGESNFDPNSPTGISVEAPAGSDLVDVVRNSLESQMGAKPDENMVMAITADLVKEAGINNPGILGADYTVSFDFKGYEGIGEVSQETIDWVQGGYDWNLNQGRSPIPGVEVLTENPGSSHPGAGAKEAFNVNPDELVTSSDTISVEVPEGSNISSEVKSILTEKLGQVPTEQQINSAAADIIKANGVADPRNIPPGFTFEINANDYKDVTSISQEKMDIVNNGYSGASADPTPTQPTSNGGADASSQNGNGQPEVDPVEPGLVEGEIPEGSSIYNEVEKLLANNMDTHPTPQQITAASADVISANGVMDPRNVPAGFNVVIDPSKYANVTQVPQAQMDLVKNGIAGAKDLSFVGEPVRADSLMGFSNQLGSTPVEKGAGLGGYQNPTSGAANPVAPTAAGNANEFAKNAMEKDHTNRTPEEWIKRRDDYGI